MLIKQDGRYFVAKQDETSEGIPCMYYGWTTDIDEATDFSSKQEGVYAMKRTGFWYGDNKIETIERDIVNE
jgi:hypothetical protein